MRFNYFKNVFKHSEIDYLDYLKTSCKLSKTRYKFLVIFTRSYCQILIVVKRNIVQLCVIICVGKILKVIFLKLKL